jgi:O-antigen/teichoic acid export membrane protein
MASEPLVECHARELGPGDGDPIDGGGAGRGVIRGSLLRLGGNLLGTLATVAASAVVIRHLGVVDTGRFLTVMALVVIVGSTSDLGVTGVAIRDYAVRPVGERQRYLRNILGIRLALAVGGLTVAVGLAALAGYTGAMVLGTVIAGLAMILLAAQQSLTIPLQVGLRFGWVAGLQLLIQIGAAAAAALLALAGAGLLAFFALQLPIILPVLALTVLAGGGETRTMPALDRVEWAHMMRKILPMSLAVVLTFLYFRLALIMVSLLSSGVQTGYFGVSFRVLDTLTTIPPLLVSSALPVLARAFRTDADRFAAAGRKLFEIMLIGGAGLAVTVFLGAEFAVRLVAGPDFGGSVTVLRILAIALLGTSVIAARGYTLLSVDGLRAILASNAIALAVVVLAGIPLIQAHGAIGAAITLLAAEGTLALCYELAATHGRPALRPSPAFVARVGCAAAAGMLPPLLLGLPSVAAAPLGALTYLLALLVLRAVPDELYSALRPGRRAAPGS